MGEPSRAPSGGEIVLGTHIEPPNGWKSDEAIEALDTFLRLGGDCVDTAPVYRFGDAERMIGAVRRRRSLPSLRVMTKAGYPSMAGAAPGESQAAWMERVLASAGVGVEEDLVDGSHLMSPAYLRWQTTESRRAMGVDRLDVLFIHNVEHRRKARSLARLHAEIADAFGALEMLVRDGSIESYGISSWHGLRVGRGHEAHVSLEAMVAIAERAGGRSHHFRAVQLPLNLGLREAWLIPTQELAGELVPAITAAVALGLDVYASSPLGRGTLAARLPAPVRELLGHDLSDAQRSLQFVRSIPGVRAAVCGMAALPHVIENMEVRRRPLVPEWALRELFG